MTFVRVAVVGCGGMGTIHARNLTALGLGEVVTFADAAPERAAALQAEVGTGTVSTDIRRAIEDPRIQAVDYCDAPRLAPRLRRHGGQRRQAHAHREAAGADGGGGAADCRGRCGERRAADGRLSGPLCPARYARESLYPPVTGFHRADD